MYQNNPILIEIKNSAFTVMYSAIIKQAKIKCYFFIFLYQNIQNKSESYRFILLHVFLFLYTWFIQGLGVEKMECTIPFLESQL